MKPFYTEVINFLNILKISENSFKIRSLQMPLYRAILSAVIACMRQLGGQGVWDTLCSLRGHSWLEKGPTNGVICHVQLGQGGIIHGLSL